MAKQIKFVTRADDAGSSHSANAAIVKVIGAGLIKNVSVMAPGSFVEEAAQMMKARKEVCFGMHATLNAEWDRVKWGPVSELPPGSGLTDENGMFLADPRMFLETKPPLELVMREYDAQLDKLCRTGFPIRYVDSHMFPEMAIEGLDEAVADWAKRKGLLDHMYYYALPPGWEVILKDMKKALPFLLSMPAGQYFIVAHPALDTEEMRMTGNAGVSGEKVAKDRNMETMIYGSPVTKHVMRAIGIRPLRYDEATPQKRLTAADVIQLLNQAELEG